MSNGDVPIRAAETRQRVAGLCRAIGNEQGTDERIIDALIGAIRPAIRLIPDDPPASGHVGRSRIGGLPDLPPNMTWPVIQERHLAGHRLDWSPLLGHPFSFLAQINLAEMAACDVEHALPTTGILYFFYIDDYSAFNVLRDYEDAATVFWLDHGTNDLRPALAPPNLPEEQQYLGLEVMPRLELTVPDPYDLLDRGIIREIIKGNLRFWNRLASSVEALQEFPHSAPKHRLLGYPDWIQSDRTPTNRRLLLQVSSDSCYAGNPHTGMEWGDAGIVYFCIAPDDLRERRFDRVECWMEMG